jgi:hypothetical protein
MLLHALLAITLSGTATPTALKGIRTVQVVTEDLGFDGTTLGLDAETLKTQVELTFRKAGIKVLSDEQVKRAKQATSWVYFNVGLVVGPQVVAYHVAVALNVSALTVASHIPVQAAVWSSGVTATSPVREASTHIREDLQDQVDKLLNALLAANQ